MAFLEAAPLTLAAADPEDVESSSSEELLLEPQQDARCARPSARIAGLLLAAVAACALLAVGLPRGSSAGALAADAPSTAQPISVRQFLEGRELADVITENYMQLGRGYVSLADRDEVHAAVSDNLANISKSLKDRLPSDHQRLDLAHMKQEQKAAVLNVLRHYSDPRVLTLGDDLGEALDDMRSEAGDRYTMQRRLSEKLRPKLRELRELGNDMAPGKGEELSVDPDDFADVEPEQVPNKRRAEAARPDRASGLPAGRRLSPADTLGATRAQATTALQHIHGMLGETVPSAPARMLLFDHQKELEKQTTGFERMSTCISDHMSSPPDLIQCLMTNCRRAMAWLMNKLHLGDTLNAAMSHRA